MRPSKDEGSCECLLVICLRHIQWLTGHVTLVEESQRRKRHAEAVMYLVPYGRYNLSESPMPLHMMKRLDDDVPPGS